MMAAEKQAEEAEFRTMFNMYDTEGTGFIVLSDTIRVLKDVGFDDETAKELAQEELESKDVDRDNRISFEEFKLAFRKLIKEADEEVEKERREDEEEERRKKAEQE